jgi:hypothetical protein
MVATFTTPLTARQTAATHSTPVRFESGRFARACVAPSLAIALESENHQATETRPVERRPSSRPLRSSRVKSGDVLVSRPTARADVYEVCVLPAVTHAIHIRYEDGMEACRQLARSLGVDAWFTCDHTHFMPIVASANLHNERMAMSNTLTAQSGRGEREERVDQRRDEADDRRPNDEVPAARREDRDPLRRDRDERQERKDRRGS